ncbi:hypothetical protein AALP_AA3G057100 [Arabis alpina]|uniref:MADS-box domain-containing protein n=1 Tax=Arabis alpina TaxID=50452 RepID=A0A087H797_ARAAL|nr:hypothetical protein AALP_AA3G057100 [Arabis alpina]
MMKKLNELKGLCGVDACGIIFDPFNPIIPDLLPNLEQVKKVVDRFEKLPESKKQFHSMDLKGFIKHAIAKGQKHLMKMKEDNKDRLMKELMFRYVRGNMGGVSMNDNTRHDLCKYMDQYVKDLIHHREVFLKNPSFEVGESSSMAPTSMDGVMDPPAMTEPSSSSFINTPIPNSSQQTNELQAMISSYERSIHANSLANNSLNVPYFSFPQPTNNFESLISSNEIPPHVNPLGGNFLNPPNFNSDELQAMVYPYLRAEDVHSFANTSQNVPNFDSDELQAMISPYQRQEDVHSFANTSQNVAIFNSPQLTNEMLPTISSSHGPRQVNVASNPFPNSNKEVYIPVMSQDEFYYPHQSQDHDQGYVQEMLKLGEKTGFPWMDNNNNKF